MRLENALVSSQIRLQGTRTHFFFDVFNLKEWENNFRMVSHD